MGKKKQIEKEDPELFSDSSEERPKLSKKKQHQQELEALGLVKSNKKTKDQKKDPKQKKDEEKVPKKNSPNQKKSNKNNNNNNNNTINNNNNNNNNSNNNNNNNNNSVKANEEISIEKNPEPEPEQRMDPNNENTQAETTHNNFPIDPTLKNLFGTISSGIFPIDRDPIVPKLIDQPTKFAENEWSQSYFRAGMSLDYVPSEEKLVVFGGYRSAENEIYTLDHANHLEAYYSGKKADVNFTWEKHLIDPKIFPRAGHSTFQIPEEPGKVFVYGGYGKRVFGDMFEIDVRNGCKTKQIEYDMSGIVKCLDRRWHCGLYYDHHYLVSHGWNVDGPISSMILFDWKTKLWKDIEFSPLQENGRTPSPRRWHSLTPLVGKSQFLLFGGYCKDRQKLLQDSYFGDFEKQIWIEASYKNDRKPPPSARHSVNILNGGKQLLFLGGYADHNVQVESKKCWILNVEEMKWYNVKNYGQIFPIVRSAHRTVSISDHSVVVAGGYLPSYVEPFYLFDTRMLSFG